jgi:hypothetical protein
MFHSIMVMLNTPLIRYMLIETLKEVVTACKQAPILLCCLVLFVVAPQVAFRDTIGLGDIILSGFLQFFGFLNVQIIREWPGWHSIGEKVPYSVFKSTLKCHVVSFIYM